MKKPLHTTSLLAAAVLSLGLAGTAAAQSTWNLSTDACDPTTNAYGNTYRGNSAGCTVDNITATVTGWATKLEDDSSSLLETARLTDQGGSGIGITSRSETTGSPQHAIDSSGKDELVLINFGTDKVSLNSVTTGWSYLDTDISVLRWDGADTGPDLTEMSIDGLDPDTGLLSSGWTLVRAVDLDGGQYSDATFNYSLSDTFNGGQGSSWWIISAYFGPDVGVGPGGGNLTAGNDYFKLLSFSGTLVPGGDGGGNGNGVPEPTSLALVAAALLGAGYTRRRKRAA